MSFHWSPEVPLASVNVAFTQFQFSRCYSFPVFTSAERLSYVPQQLNFSGRYESDIDPFVLAAWHPRLQGEQSLKELVIYRNDRL